jgi:hypothetical protein
MSNNDEMDVEKDRGHGLQAPNKKNEGHGVRGQTCSSHGTSENERESRDISSNVIHKYILGSTTLTKITSSGPK